MSNCRNEYEHTNEKDSESETEWDEMKQIIFHPIETYNSMSTLEKIGCFFPHAFLCCFMIYNCAYGF